jgi:hypothetical protein
MLLLSSLSSCSMSPTAAVARASAKASSTIAVVFFINVIVATTRLVGSANCSICDFNHTEGEAKNGKQ